MQVQEKNVNGFRLSPQQTRLWNLQENFSLNNAQLAILIEGNLNITSLKDALHKVIENHEVFRTYIFRPPGIKTPIQSIAEKGLFSWQEINLSNLSYNKQFIEVEKILKQEQQKSFDLKQNVLVRVFLIKLGADKQLLIINFPPICVDNYSCKNFIQEISKYYQDCLEGKELPNEEIVQYIQFAEWSNELLEDPDSEAGKQYWQQQELFGLDKLKLPFEKQILKNNSQFEVANIDLKVLPELLDKIEFFSENHQTSIADFLLACWQILLGRFLEQSNICVGIEANGRKYEELETAIGVLAKYVPLQVKLDPNLSFKEVLQTVNQLTQDANEWQEYFILENEELTFFPFCFEFQEQLKAYQVADVSFSVYKQFTYLDKFKIKLSCIQQESQLLLSLNYDSNLFPEEAIQSLADNFQTLLMSAITHPKTAINKLNVLSDRSLQKLLVEFNNTQENFLIHKCIHQLFEEQAEQTPDNLALVFEEEQLTYAQLNQQANQLAHYLQTLGVKSDTLVGIYLERSLQVIVALLAILKAGGAYVPFDSALPIESLSLRLEDDDISFLLTQQKLVEQLPSSNTKIVDLDQDRETIATQNYFNPSSRVTPENLVYVIYTSGSTGKPKGVAIEHQNLLNYTKGIIKELNLPVSSSFATVSTLAADLGNTVIFPALCTGGCLHIISKDKASDPQALATYFTEHSIDCLKIVPSHLSALLTSSEFKSVLPRKRLILGGEALNWSLIDKLKNLAPDCAIFNHYGPTETTIGVLTYPINLEKIERQSATVPLGRPIANTQIYLLDENLNPVPLGVKGQLYIGGASLGRSYLNRSDLTLEKFIVNPFVDLTPGASTRLYKTGDMARYLPDGTIEFLGRVDNQVKIRGYRIELEEIEALLNQHPEIEQGVVISSEESTGDKRLIAYLVSRQKSQPSSTTIREFLKAKLPDYMIPSAFVVVKSLPLTANGKIDRKALATLDLTSEQSEDSFVPPRNPIEQVLTEIWSEVLGIKNISIYDDFFQLGGHSLLMTQLVVKVREMFEIDISLSSLFETTTVVQLAQKIETAIASGENRIIASPIDFESEAVLDPAIRPETPFIWSTSEPSAIFLTGATGFLGCFLLYELLTETPANIYCLVRSSNEESAQAKIQESLESYSLWNESFNDRIIPVLGELSKPRLGLSEEHFKTLANQIDIIYHNGALVNFIYPYAALKAANVLSTQEILRLASQEKTKPVHFISSTNAISPKEGSGVMVIQESDTINPNDVMETGYAKSKWVAEKLIMIAREREIPVCIYRPGRIVWHSQTGIGNTKDNTFRMLKGCIQLGSVPQLDGMVNLIPVDFVSKAIVYLSRQKNSLGKAFHLVNPQPAHWNEVVNWVRSFGYSLREIPEEEWREELKTIAGKSPENALYPLVPFWSKSEAKVGNAPVLKFDCQNTFKGIGDSFTCPPVSAELFNRYLSFLIKEGHL